MKLSRIVIAGLMSLAISAVWAQGGARPGGPGGRPGQGGMRMGGFRGGGGRLLLNDKVQKELKMTKAQIAKADKLFGGQGGMGGPGGAQGGNRGGGAPGGARAGGPGGGGQGGDAQREARRLATEKQVKSVIDAKQFARYRQIQLQLQGANVLTRADIAKEVGLTSAQVKKIEDIRQKQFQSMGFGAPPGGGRPPAGGNRGGARGGQPPAGGRGGPPGASAGGGDMRAQFQKMRDEMDKKILAVLTASQRQKWQSMLGPKFSLQ